MEGGKQGWLENQAEWGRHWIWTGREQAGEQTASWLSSRVVDDF